MTVFNIRRYRCDLDGCSGMVDSIGHSSHLPSGWVEREYLVEWPDGEDDFIKQHFCCQEHADQFEEQMADYWISMA